MTNPTDDQIAEARKMVAIECEKAGLSQSLRALRKDNPWVHAVVSALATVIQQRDALREALLKIELLSTNHSGRFEQGAWAWGQMMGDTARTALAGAGS